jgi:hypothetical protein
MKISLINTIGKKKCLLSHSLNCWFPASIESLLYLITDEVKQRVMLMIIGTDHFCSPCAQYAFWECHQFDYQFCMDST